MKDDRSPLRDAHEDIESARHVADSPQAQSPAYRLAFADPDFLCREELRPVRLQLELLKPQLEMDERGIESTVVLFGGARIREPGAEAKTETLREMSRYYTQAREFARLITERSVATGCRQHVVVTGGGPGVMEAGNRGAEDAGGCSIGLNIVLPHEQVPNGYITPELCFNFHYFGIRKMHFLIRAEAIAVFPGGFGTMDELFETLTLIQTGRMEQVPVILFGEAFWRKLINFEMLVESGTISPEDLDLFRFVETASDAIAVIDGWDKTGRRGDIPGR